MNGCAYDVLVDILSLVCIEVSVETVAGWTDEQRTQAEVWALKTHLKASDHPYVRVPPKPEFLPEEKRDW